MRLPWIARGEYDRLWLLCQDAQDAAAASRLDLAQVRQDLATERDRYERLVDKMAELQRAGFTSREPVRYQSEAPSLPEPILAAIVARGGGLGSETGRLLTGYALAELAAGKSAEQVETAIWDGEGG